MTKPNPEDAVALLRGTPDAMYWVLQQEYGVDFVLKYPEMTFDEAVAAVQEEAHDRHVRGLVQTTFDGRTWYLVPPSTASSETPIAPPARALPVWKTSRRALRKAVRKAKQRASRHQ